MSSAEFAVSAGAGTEAWATSKSSAHMSPISEVQDTTIKRRAAAADDRERSASRSVSPPFLPSLSWRRHRLSASDSSSISSRLSLATGSITSISPPPSSSLSPTYTDSSYDQHAFVHANPWATSKGLGRGSSTSSLASPITLNSVGDDHIVPSPGLIESDGAMALCPSSRPALRSAYVPVEACGPPPQLSSREPLVFAYRLKRRNRESWDSALGSDMNGRRTRGSSLAGPDFQPFPAALTSNNNSMPPPPPPREANRMSISSITESVIHIEPRSSAPRPLERAEEGHEPQAYSSQEQCDETSSDTTLPAEDAAGRILNYTLDVAFGLGAYNVEASSVCRSVVHNFISDLGWAVEQAQQQEEDVVDDLRQDPESPSDAGARGGQPQQQPARNSSGASNNAQRASKRRSGGGGGRGKRKSQELSDDEQDGEDSNDEGDAKQSEPGPSKRVKPNPAVRMSCPYRIRNPLRFNVRDHRLCALTVFTDTAELRRHIQDCHKRPANSPHRCLRCKVQFDSMESLHEHVMSWDTAPCPKNPSADAGGVHNPEDGIDNAIANQLRCKKGRVSDSIEVQWQKIWSLLFPDIEVQPYDYCAVMEHHELKEKYLSSMWSLNKSLSVIGLGERGLETLDRILTNHFIGLFEQCNEEGRSKDYRNRQPKSAAAQVQQQMATAASPDSIQLRKQSSLRKRLAAAQRDSGFVEDDQSIVGGLQEAGVVGGGASPSEEGGGGGGCGGKLTPFMSDNGSSSSPGDSFRKLQQQQQQQQQKFTLPSLHHEHIPAAGFPPDGPFGAAPIAGLDASLLAQSDDAAWVMDDSFVADYEHSINTMATAEYRHAQQIGHGGFGFPVHLGANAVPVDFAGSRELPDALQDSTSAWVYSQQL